MKKFKIHGKSAKRLALFAVLTTLLLTGVLAVHIFAAEEETENYIYFDLAAGNVKITGSKYEGYIYKTVNGVSSSELVSGTHNADNKYYIYQSSASNRSTTGLIDDSTTVVVPTYPSVMYDTTTTWGDYITNHPSRSADKADSVDEVITAWNEAAPNAGRSGTTNVISVSGTGTFNVLIDNVWSSYSQKLSGDKQYAGGFTYVPDGTSGTLNLKLKGDNRFGHFHCATHDGNNDNYKTDKQHTNRMTVTTVDGKDSATLTVCNLTEGSDYNHTGSAIGGTDYYDHSVKMEFNHGTIYAAGSKLDFCTAIGGGGNGPGRITINGGRITAVTSSTGTALGGGCGTTGPGGYGNVTINGGEVYAYAYQPYSKSYSQYNGALPTAIGGGSSGTQIGGLGIVSITGGYIYAYSEKGNAIGGGGGGIGFHKQNYYSAVGGIADVSISGGTIEAISDTGTAIGGGPGGGINYTNYYSINSTWPTDTGTAAGTGYRGKEVVADGGTAKLTISGSPIIYTGSIGGGAPLDKYKEKFAIGAAIVHVSGTPTIQGQIVMDGIIKNTSVIKNYLTNGIDGLTDGLSSSFTMSGGTIDNTNAATSFFKEANGGAVCVKSGTAIISGGTIQNCGGDEMLGGAIYLTGGDVTLTGTGMIQDCQALSGGAIYVADGNVTVSDGTIQNCEATQGGAIYVAGGNVTVSGGTITGNTATEDGGGAYLGGGTYTVSGGTISANKAVNGGAAYVANGNVVVEDGEITGNTAVQNGGAFSITNGNYTMTGGAVSGNTATSGDGGGIYVSSTASDATITVRSGKVIKNSAGRSGGAIGVHGNEGVSFTITLGSNTDHSNLTNQHVCGESTEPCPIITENTAVTSGGGIYLAGSLQAIMNIHCLVEKDNTAEGGVSDSNFMKVEGGTLTISTLDESGTENCGNVVINSSVHVTGGAVTLKGSGNNPLFLEPVTVDVDTAAGSEFKDQREGGTAYTIQYFENFEKEGQASGQYTLIDFKEGQIHTVRAAMYSNVGFSIDGWKLMEKNGEEWKVIDTYSANDKITVDRDLIFYANWVVVGYTIQFEPGVDSYQGTMEPQGFAYTETKALTANAFINAGYTFQHWVDKADKTKTYTDAQEVSQLTDVHGSTITLIAVWAVCDHNNTTYTVTAAENVLSRQCSCLGYTETATLSGVTATYDEKEHPATVYYSRETVNGLKPNVLWEFTISYTGEKWSGESFTEFISVPVNAGKYVATISCDGKSASVAVTIRKAEQDPPGNLPTYKTEPNGEDMEIVITDAYDSRLEYLFTWYDTEKNMYDTSTWMPSQDSSQKNVSHTIKKIYTNYYVDVRYAETDNYYASVPVRGASVIVYTGNVTFNISSGEGLIREEVIGANETGITVTFTPQSGYFIYQITTEVFKSDAGQDQDYALPTLNYTQTTSDMWELHIDKIQDSTSGTVTITIHFTGAVKKATVQAATVKDQVFRDITDLGQSDVTISQDSAYTFLFTVENYEHYTAPSIAFNQELPVNTTIIMKDWSDSSYWGCTVSAATNTVPLSNFARMDGVQAIAGVAGADKRLKLQFIVDFSRCTTTPLGTGTLTAQLSATQDHPDGLGTVPELPTDESATSSVTLVAAPEFRLFKGDATTDDTWVQAISYQYAYQNAVAEDDVGMSKWANRRGILVVTPKENSDKLPQDARLQVKIGNSTTNYPLKDGKFVVALPSSGTGTAYLSLLSDMLPNESINFGFQVELYASNTAVKGASDEKLRDQTVEITYTVTAETEAILHATLIEKPSYDGTTMKSVKIQVQVKNLPANHSVRATIYSKHAKEGIYTSTTQTASIYPANETDGTDFQAAISRDVEISLDSFKETMHQSIGSISLMLRVEIVDPNGKVVSYIPLYCILEDTRQ